MNIKEHYLQTTFYQTITNLDRRYLYAVLIDIVYYGIFLAIGSFFWFIVYPKMLQIREAFDTIDTLQGLDMLNTYFKQAQGYTVLVILTLFISYNIFKWLIWKILLAEKIFPAEQGTFAGKAMAALKELGTFSLINLSYLITVIAIVVISHFLLAPKFFSYLLLLAYIPFFVYLLLFLHPVFMKDKSFLKTYKHLYHICIKNIFHLIGPYLILILFLFIWTGIIQVLLFLPQTIYAIIYIVWMALLFNYAKVYAYHLSNE